MDYRQDKTDVICLGQAVVDCITRGRENAPDGKLAQRADSIRLSTGGDAVNESFVLAGMGINAELVCGLGNDLAGTIIMGEARRRGVGTERISIVEEMDTPVANLMVSADGSRYSVNSRATMLPGYLPGADAVKGARVVSFASLFRAPLDRKETIISLIRSAWEDGAVICADTKLPTFRELTLADISEVLPMVSYIFPNEKEAAFYTGEDSFPRMAEVFHSCGIKNVVIKAGAQGCFMSTGKDSFSLPALPVEAVDTTGAGDNFVAGFISGILEGDGPHRCCERALAKAAESIQHMGAVV